MPTSQPHEQVLSPAIATPRTTLVLQPEQDGEPDTRAELRIYIADELMATSLRRIANWPDCQHCGKPIDVMVEAHATPDGLHHDGCTTRRRARS